MGRAPCAPPLALRADLLHVAIEPGGQLKSPEAATYGQPQLGRLEVSSAQRSELGLESRMLHFSFSSPRVNSPSPASTTIGVRLVVSSKAGHVSSRGAIPSSRRALMSSGYRGEADQCPETVCSSARSRVRRAHAQTPTVLAYSSTAPCTPSATSRTRSMRLRNSSERPLPSSSRASSAPRSRISLM